MKQDIVFTKHAKERLLQRNINEETIRTIVETPDYTKTSFSGRMMAVKKINEILWNVVYVQTAKNIKVITIYYE